MWSIICLALCLGAAFAPMQYTSTAAAEVAKAKATALTESPTSNIARKTFNRFVTIFMENTDYDTAAADPNLKWVASQGIVLSNYFAVTHPSQPDHVASVGGDTHGVKDDGFFRIDSSVQTIVDLLEAKRISWSEYEEDSPYSGFQGNYTNQKTVANDYVRKHNPLMSYDAVASNLDRFVKIKNFTMFETDLNNNQLPQWMFITPNMTNDGHDTSATIAASWARSFPTPLLSNSNFMQKTLVLLTFDESENYKNNNRVYSILLGAVPPSSKGATDSNLYNYYSQMVTVEKNWDLGNLGLNNTKASVFF